MPVPDTTAEPVPPPAKSAITFVNALSVIIVGAFVSVIFTLMFVPVTSDPASQAVVNQLVGVLQGAFATVVAFHLGSSKSSEDKTDTIKKMATTGTGNGTGNGAKPP